MPTYIILNLMKNVMTSRRTLGDDRVAKIWFRKMVRPMDRKSYWLVKQIKGM